MRCQRIVVAIISINLFSVGVLRSEGLVEHPAPPKPTTIQFHKHPQPVEFDLQGRRGVASLEVHPRRMKYGTRFEIETQIVNTSHVPYDVYYKTRGVLLPEPALMLSEPPSMLLIVFDEHGTPLGNQYHFQTGSFKGLCDNDWRRLPPGGIMRMRHRLPPPRGDDGSVTSQMTPGKYYMQVIFLDRFLSPCPIWTGEAQTPTDRETLAESDRKAHAHKEFVALQTWMKGYSDRPLFYSNTVQFEIVDE